ncbi:50S ribosomal protein L33 [Candidatus Dojkabacteria bacterium]|nr:50S ribosomal protein L33 [Candidatus Dojkabacteria bacterium]
MAKKEIKTVIALQCSECKSKNYTTYKSKQLQGKLNTKKHCNVCGKHTVHNETKAK